MAETVYEREQLRLRDLMVKGQNKEEGGLIKRGRTQLGKRYSNSSFCLGGMTPWHGGGGPWEPEVSLILGPKQDLQGWGPE